MNYFYCAKKFTKKKNFFFFTALLVAHTHLAETFSENH